MLLIKVGDWGRHNHMAEPPRDILDCFLDLPAQAGAKPGIERWREALLPAPSDFGRNPIWQTTAQQSFALASRKVIPDRQMAREGKEFSIQERSSTFHRTEHAGTVDFHEDL